MSQIGNPNQPNFSYIPIRATSASAHLAPSPTPPPLQKNNRWENEVLHFSRRPCVTNEPREYYEAVVEEHSMRSGSPCYVQKKQPSK